MIENVCKLLFDSEFSVFVIEFIDLVFGPECIFEAVILDF